MSRKDDSIELSPKYGLNPTIGICFYCGKESGELAMMGRIRERDKNGRAVPNSDVEAPKKMLLSYNPCSKCEEKLKNNFCVYSVEPANGRQPLISKGMVAVGCAFVPNDIAKDFVNDIFNISDEEKEQLLEKKAVLIDTPSFKKIFGDK